MNDQRHLLRLWLIGNLILMATLGTLTGALLQHWQKNPVLPEQHSALLVATGLMAVGLFAAWFRSGHRLWVAVKAR